MPKVATEGQYEFVIRTREFEYEPPHVHVIVGSDEECRIRLNDGTYMDDPPPGHLRDILDAYALHAEAIRETWDRIHGR